MESVGFMADIFFLYESVYNQVYRLQFVEVDPVHDDILRKKEEQDREKPQRHLFRFPHMGMWTKLRPGIWNFLEKVNFNCYLFLVKIFYSCLS